MSGETETTRLHSSPVTTARKRIRYAGAIIALISMVAVVSHSGTFSGTNPSTSQVFVDAAGGPAAQNLEKQAEEFAKLRLPVAAVDGVALTGKIITCPGCKLNSLPSVKKFVHEYAKHFGEKLKVDFQVGEDPVLHLFKGDEEVEEIALEPYSWDKIVKLLVERGITPVAGNKDIDEVVAKMIEQAK